MSDYPDFVDRRRGSAEPPKAIRDLARQIEDLTFKLQRMEEKIEILSASMFTLSVSRT